MRKTNRNNSLCRCSGAALLLLFAFVTTNCSSCSHASNRGAEYEPPSSPSREDSATSDRGGLVSLNGPGYTITVPSSWIYHINRGGFDASVRLPAGTVTFTLSRFDVSSADEVFANCQSLLSSVANTQVLLGNRQRTVYGKWQGESESGQQTVNGMLVEFSCTAIPANGTYYAFVMGAPVAMEYAGYKVRAALADNIDFDELPETSKGRGASCTNCGQMLMGTMNTLTGQTLDMMQ